MRVSSGRNTASIVREHHASSVGQRGKGEIQVKDRFLVLHFGGQCPWHLWVIEEARRAARKVHCTLEVVDVMENPEMASRHRLFFPFMTVIDDSIRLPSPIKEEELMKIRREGLSATPTIPRRATSEGRARTVEPLTPQNIIRTCHLCIPDHEKRGCLAKKMWASKLKGKVREDIVGFIAYQEEETVGAVEFLPSPLVPYPLPEKDPHLAFITCIYSLEGGPDYRGQILDVLIGYLSNKGFRRLQTISGRRSPYPNGPSSFFQSHGFRELGEVDSVVLREGEEELVLMEKEL